MRRACAKSGGLLRSRRQPVDDPRAGVLAVASIANAIVQARGATLPELDRVRDEAVPAPVRWTGHGTACIGKARLRLGEARLERRASRYRLALRRRPRTELRCARTAGEIGGRFRGFERRRDTL